MSNSDSSIAPQGKTRRIPTSGWEYLSLAIMVGVIASVIYIELQTQLIDSWAYDRSTFAVQSWTAVSHALVHLNIQHMMLNVTALGCIFLLFRSAFHSLWWLVALAASAASSAWGMYYYSPETDWCVGMSGALHGLFVYAALRSRAHLLWIAAVAIKLLIEQQGLFDGQLLTEATAHFIANPVVVDAHLWGVAGGFIVYGIARTIAAIQLIIELNGDN